MEDLVDIYRKSEVYCAKLEEQKKEYLQKLRILLWGQAAVKTVADEPDILGVASPQQIKKRVKRLPSLQEDQGEENLEPDTTRNSSTRTSNAKLLAAAADIDEPSLAAAVEPTKDTDDEEEPKKPENASQLPVQETLMPPPPARAMPNEEQSFGRPQRAAKLKSEKNLKEPKLNQKMRRPSNSETVKVKIEKENRQSQMVDAGSLLPSSSKTSLASNASEDSVVVVPGKAPSTVVINSDDDNEDVTVENKLQEQQSKASLDKSDRISATCRQLRVKVKRENFSVTTDHQIPPPIEANDQTTFVAPQTVPMPKEAPVKIENMSDESTMASTILSATTSTSAAPSKRGRKKKEAHKPIKVERFSDIDAKPSPISSRTRHGSFGRSQKSEEKQTERAGGSIYEDAVETLEANAQLMPSGTETPPTRISQVPNEVVAAAAGINETVTVAGGGGAAVGINQTVTVTGGDAQPNATMVLSGAPGDSTFCANPAQTTFQVAPGQTTFVMDNANATITLTKKSDAGGDMIDATFNVPLAKEDAQGSFASSKHSMETAKDTTHPHDNSLITEDESFEKPLPVAVLPVPKAPSASKLPTSAKAYKMPTRTNELFNPLVQSPVKMKVKAFENAAELTKPGRPKRTKENALSTQTSSTTPVIGKLHAPILGRFLTPTQASNITPNSMAHPKKAPNSASKAMAFPKATISSSGGSSTNLKTTNSTSSKTLSRENSADDFRKGIHQIAEERKKQREQKHLLAAQQREAKERERAERMAKLAKEREEKRVKKQLEAEHKKRELDEIQRKLRQQEEAAAAAEAAMLKAAKTKAIMDQERELLTKMKQPKPVAKQRVMAPPPSKAQSKYTFEMLHEDDSTDDEGKTSYKRPTPPTWSRSHVRGPTILVQQYWPTDIIDSFFSVQPMTPDLKAIFPNIDARHLKRNSSVLWSTPPRYSELPKY